jgi:hypothetical protein
VNEVKNVNTKASNLMDVIDLIDLNKAKDLIDLIDLNKAKDLIDLIDVNTNNTIK